VPLTDATLARAQASDAVLFGSVGGPKWEKLPFELQPERGLLKLRKEMDLFANLRPAQVFEALADASSLKRELVAGLDLLIVRELTGGIYFGDPRGIETMPTAPAAHQHRSLYRGRDRARRARRLRAGAQASQAALRGRQGQCHGVGHPMARKSPTGCMPTTPMSRSASCTPTIGAMQLVRQPKQFDVIVTSNLFGDLLSDCAAMLTGSLGMLPSASLGAADASGRRKALYEPVHGSAPDIAGQNVANPLASILSFAMMLRYSFDLGDEADWSRTRCARPRRRRAHRRHRRRWHPRLDPLDGRRGARPIGESGLGRGDRPERHLSARNHRP